MKSIILFLLIGPGLVLNAQFPSPNDFEYSSTYIPMDEWGVCNGQALTGPAYCSVYSWRMPDTSATDADLQYFEIYNNENGDIHLIRSLSDTSYTESLAYTGDFYIVAVYSNPDGSSEPSNIINNPGLPIKIKDFNSFPHILTICQAETGLLKIFTNRIVTDIMIINSLGQAVYSQTNPGYDVNLGNLSPGIYFVKLSLEGRIVYYNKFLKY